MCAACGVATHVPPPPVTTSEQIVAGPGTAAPGMVQPTATAGAVQPTGAVGTAPRFAALRSRDCRYFLGGTALSMMADNIEHVITYWVLWQAFHSPALAGFAVISHWVPFLLSVYFGGLADRYDCRRVIQAAQALFMAVSVGWGVLFVTDSLTVWFACILLVVHGIAGALWGPAEQLMLHDFVDRPALPSAVRLNATARSLGILFGPVVGSALLIGLGPTAGIFVNVAIYLPLTVFLARTRFTGHVRGDEADVRSTQVSAFDAIRVIREVSSNATLVSMIAIGGLGSFFIGASLQSAMPIFAMDLQAGNAGVVYSVLLFAHGAGGVIGGLLLEVTGRIGPTVRAAIVSTLVYGAAMLGFAVTGSYVAAIVLLVIGGTANLASMSISQTIVQLLAPSQIRGRVIGVYGMAANGLRAGSGLTVGLLGGIVGVHWSLAVSGAALTAGTALVAGYVALARSRAAVTLAAPGLSATRG